MRQERLAGGTLDMDTSIPSTILSHGVGYIDKDREQIVGLQTDKPLKRALMTFGGINMAVNSCKAYGYEVDEEVIKIFLTTVKLTTKVYSMHILQKCV